MSMMLEAIKTLSMILVLAYLLAHANFFSEEGPRKQLSPLRFIISVFVFLLISLYGTMSTAYFDPSTYFDTRLVGVSLAALLFDLPVSLTVLGVTIATSVLMASPNLLADIIAMLIAFGLIKVSVKRFSDRDSLLYGIMIGAVEMAHMLLIFILTQPADFAKDFVYTYSYPTIVLNGCAVILFVLIITENENHKKLWEKETASKSQMDAAGRIQYTLLENNFKVDWRIDLHAFLRPAYNVGGDLYGFKMQEGRYFCFILGDVSGKGIPAAIMMSRCKTAFSVFIQDHREPNEILSNVNLVLNDHNDEQMFVTAIAGVLDLETGHLTYSNAGHTQSYIVSFGEDCTDALPANQQPDVRAIEKPSGPALGLYSRKTYNIAEIDLKPGDYVFLYTDGVIDATNNERVRLGESGLVKALKSQSVPDACTMVTSIQQTIDNYQPIDKQFDDIAMMVFGWDTRPMHYDIKATLEDLVTTEDRLNSELTFRGVAPALRDNIILCVEEIISNIIKYGYKDASSAATSAVISLDVSPRPEGSIISITDTSNPYDPFTSPDPDLSLPGAYRPSGKLGIFMIRPLVESYSYESIDNEPNGTYNHLTLKLVGEKNAAQISCGTTHDTGGKG